MHGQLVCWHHGGAAPNSIAAANRRLAQEEADRLLVKHLKDAPPMTSVGEIYDDLLAVAGLARTWRTVLQDRVSELERLDQYGDQTRQVAVDVQLFERALDRCAKIGADLARLNLEERKQALDERLAAQLTGCIRLILGDLDLTVDQMGRAQEVVPARLRELAV